ncbi:MAG: polymerase sigma-70 factor, subfamily [Mycobacterium sp.]|jgi:RNA polymerase sigma-70 factor (ECF subfamily)|nr:polymerase sigma-70 factor, subfamily [Mycobacterium sp.]
MTEQTLMRQALANLSSRHRAVIYRAYFLKRTTAQIAAEFDTSECAVRARLHDAMRELRCIMHAIYIAA